MVLGLKKMQGLGCWTMLLRC